MSALYDRIGTTYTATRSEDPRIAHAIHGVLGEARTVLNVGAGSGSYEPHDREVTAVEPSAGIIAQNPPGGAPGGAGPAQAVPVPHPGFRPAKAVLPAPPPG